MNLTLKYNGNKTADDSRLVNRIPILVAILLIFMIAWISYREVPMVVIGQPSKSGRVQKEKETAFFQNLQAVRNLPLKVTYRTVDTVGFKDNYQLQMLKDGTFDLVSLRFAQNSEIEPALNGIDPVGLNSDWETARQIVRQYSSTVDQYLQKTYQAKLLGVWAFGPQVFYCIKPVRSLTDLQGLKVRVGGQYMASLMKLLGALPAVLSFDEAKSALANGLVDCAVTSGASGNFAGWPEFARYYFPLVTQFGLNGYVISLKKWNTFSKVEQKSLQSAFDLYVDDLWRFSEEIDVDVSSCNTGRNCRDGNSYHMVLLEPSSQDLERLKMIVKTSLLPEWFKKCEALHSGCQDEWNQKVMPLVGH